MKNFFEKHGYCPYSSSCEECNWLRACENSNLSKERNKMKIDWWLWVLFGVAIVFILFKIWLS